MILVILAGIGVGSGILLVLRGLFPAPLTLQAALDALSGTPNDLSLDTLGEGGNGARRLAARALEVNLAKVPRLADVVVPDLAITGTPPERFAIKVMGYAIAMALMAPLLAVAAGTVGIHVGFEVPLLGILLLGAGGGALPFIDLHTAAERRRRHFCHSLAIYASLVSMAMAGSMGWSSALEAASSVSSTDWAMDEIAQALLWSQAYHRPPWEGLDRLAERFALPDLSDLARSMAQAGEGARIRSTLEGQVRLVATGGDHRHRTRRPGGHPKDAPARCPPNGRLRRPHLLPRARLIHRLPSMTTNQPEGHLMQTIREHLKEAFHTASTLRQVPTSLSGDPYGTDDRRRAGRDRLVGRGDRPRRGGRHRHRRHRGDQTHQYRQRHPNAVGISTPRADPARSVIPARRV